MNGLFDTFLEDEISTAYAAMTEGVQPLMYGDKFGYAMEKLNTLENRIESVYPHALTKIAYYVEKLKTLEYRLENNDYGYTDELARSIVSDIENLAVKIAKVLDSGPCSEEVCRELSDIIEVQAVAIAKFLDGAEYKSPISEEYDVEVPEMEEGGEEILEEGGEMGTKIATLKRIAVNAIQDIIELGDGNHIKSEQDLQEIAHIIAGIEPVQ
jgi:hypothetical protein